ncbi:hypothetical protein [Pseudophaeobacter sp.]|uniref:hypothetical protein n=1 Tax=Pseudophaeobacter sp. TaxID=1971739 RepID=UPI00329986BF
MTKSAAFLPALVLASIAAFAVAPATAKPLSRMLAQSPLSPDDFNAMRAAEAALYEHTGTKVGSSVKWKNPETGSYGAVRITSKSGGCVSLQHKAHPNGGPAATDVSRKFCKAASGKWLLSE